MRAQIQSHPPAVVQIFSTLAHILRKQCPSFSHNLYLLIVPTEGFTKDLGIETHTFVSPLNHGAIPHALIFISLKVERVHRTVEYSQSNPILDIFENHNSSSTMRYYLSKFP